MTPRQRLPIVRSKIETGRAYDVRIEARGRRVTLYLDGKKWGSFTDDKVAEPFRQVVTRDKATGELIVKVVNAQDAAARTRIDGLAAGDRSGHRPRSHPRPRSPSAPPAAPTARPRTTITT